MRRNRVNDSYIDHLDGNTEVSREDAASGAPRADRRNHLCGDLLRPWRNGRCHHAVIRGKQDGVRRDRYRCRAGAGNAAQPDTKRLEPAERANGFGQAVVTDLSSNSNSIVERPDRQSSCGEGAHDAGRLALSSRPTATSAGRSTEPIHRSRQSPSETPS